MNPNIRRNDETQKQFNERRRAQNSAAKAGGWMFWPSRQKGTYLNSLRNRKTFNARGQFPKLKPQPETANGKNNKFKGFRKIRGIHAASGISIWVHA